MSEPDDHHGENVVVDGVEDSMVTDTDAESVASLKCARPWGARVASEQCDGALNAVADLRIEPA